MPRKRRKEIPVQSAPVLGKTKSPATVAPAPIDVASPEDSTIPPPAEFMQAPPLVPEPAQGVTPRQLVRIFTVEVGLYVLLFLVAVTMRLFNLGGRPLAEHEAAIALSAWQFLQGQGAGAINSPLLFTSNLFAFFLGASTDAAPRVLPALIGSLGVLLPVLVRREIGRTGAMVASLLLVLSTGLVYFARDSNGVEISVIAGIAAGIWFLSYASEHRPRVLYLGVSAAAVSLTASSAAYTVLLAGLLFALYPVLVKRRDAASSAPREPAADQPEAASNGSSKANHEWRNALLLFVGLYVGLSTAFLMNRAGLGAAFNLLGDWLGQFAAWGPLTSPLNLLLLYEPLVLVFGLAGLLLVPTVLGDWRNNRIVLFMAALALTSLIVYSVAGVKTTADMVVIAVPLALLAGWFLGHLIERSLREMERGGGLRTALWGELPILLVALLFAAFFYLQFVMFLTGNRFGPLLDPILRLVSPGGTASSIEVALGMLAVGGLVIAAFLIAAAIGSVGSARTANLAAMVVGILLFAAGIRALWLSNYWLPGTVHELIADQQTSLQARDLLQDLMWQSEWRGSDQHIIAGHGDPSAGPVVRWYLREFPNLHWDQLSAAEQVQALVTPAQAPAPAGAWISQHYDIQMNWSLQNASRTDLFKWLIFREGGTETWQSVQLWVHPPQ
ncbi:MAG: hypothetical protein WCF84_04730 [Anaerolineae bacterium]